MLSRRKFLGLAGGAAASGTAVWAGLLRDRVGDRAEVAPFSTLPPAPDRRVLVVVQLAGGNDGLNTLVPLDGRYHDLRPTLAIDDAAVVALGGEERFALHPSLAPLAEAWAAGRLAFVEGVGFEGSSRSHFEASSAWWTATPDASGATGWLGRWLDTQAGAVDNPLAAIAVGGFGTPALRSEHSLATVIADPAAFTLRAPTGVDGDALVEAFLATAVPLDGEPVRASAQRAVVSSVDAVRTLGQALASSGEVDSLTSSLAVAANVIGLDLGTRVVLVGSGGFDTHANQRQTHDALLTDLAGGLSAFLAALDADGLADEVLVVTTSEFGRRAAQNGSAGTDHGSAGVQVLAGGPSALVASQVVGDADLSDLVDGDLRATVDVRSLYSIALDWLGGPTDEVLGGEYDRMGVLRPA